MGDRLRDLGKEGAKTDRVAGFKRGQLEKERALLQKINDAEAEISREINQRTTEKVLSLGVGSDPRRSGRIQKLKDEIARLKPEFEKLSGFPIQGDAPLGVGDQFLGRDPATTETGRRLKTVKDQLADLKIEARKHLETTQSLNAEWEKQKKTIEASDRLEKAINEKLSLRASV